MTEVKDENGFTYKISDMIAEGGQGRVYKVVDSNNIVLKTKVDENGEILADKNEYNKFKREIRNIITIGEFPYTALPTIMLEEPVCGYIMRFMTGLTSIGYLMQPYIYKFENGDLSFYERSKKKKRLAKNNDEFIFAYNSTGGLKKRLLLLAKLAKIMAGFQDKSIVYCDLSPANIFVSEDRHDAEAWLIDMDNLAHEGEVLHSIGTPQYMSPEVYNGSKNTVKSDEYSFAVIAFQLLTYNTPFSGKLQEESIDDDYDDFDAEDTFENDVLAGNIPWVYEYNDSSNRSKKGLPADKLLTKGLMDLFEQTFNQEGRKNPSKRPNMWDWYEELILAYESLASVDVDYSEEFHKSVLKLEPFDSYCGSINVFNKDKETSRIKVNISLLMEVSDDDGNKEYLTSHEKTIYWSKNSNSIYNLSNFDIERKNPDIYIPDYVSIARLEDLDNKKYYRIDPRNNIKAVFIKDGIKYDKVEDLLDYSLYILKNNKPIKKISFEEE